jgi:hypothetical protein
MMKIKKPIISSQIKASSSPGPSSGGPLGPGDEDEIKDNNFVRKLFFAGTF